MDLPPPSSRARRPPLPARAAGLLAPLSIATGLLAATAAGLPAAVQFVDLSAAPVAIPSTLDGLYLNIAAGTWNTGPVPVTGWDLSLYNGGTALTFLTPSAPEGQGMLHSASAVLALTGGQLIGSGGLYQSGMTAGTAFLGTGQHYAGFSFYNEATSSLNYGWILLSHTQGSSGSSGFPASLLAYAWEDSGQPLETGAIPEPSVPAALLLASAMRLRRSRKRKAPAA